MTLFAAGDKPTAAQINNNIAPGWTTYTVTWSCSTSAPSLGNGTLTGRWRRPTDADMMVVEIKLTWGSTTTPGTGFFIFSLPANASTTSLSTTIGLSFIDDVSTQGRPGSCRFNTAGDILADNSAGAVTGASPMTFATGDKLYLRMEYEPA